MRSTTTVTAEEQPSTSNTIAQTQSTSVSTSSGGFRRSLYQSLPLYWQKGWRTHGAELDGPAIQQKRFSKRHTTTGHVTSTAASLPPKPSRPDNRRKRSSPADSAYRFLLDGQQKPAEDKQQRRNISWQRTTFKYKPNQRLQNATSTHIPEEHVRHGRLILLTLISGSCLLLLLSLLHILGPSFFVPTEQPTHTTVNSLKKELKKLKSAYSEIRPSEAQIWLLNTHEFYRRQKRQVSDAQPANDPYLFGLARLCGSNCTFRLKHGMAQTNFGESIHGEKLNIKLSRMKSVKNQKFIEKQKSFFLFPLNNSSSKRQSNLPHSAFQRVQSSILPLIQLMDSDNMTELRRPHISPNCFYIAEVELASEQSLLNLCDRNGGMFGSLALVEGAFLIEPLLLEDEEEHYEQQSADKPQKQRRRRRMTSPAELRPHLIYPVRTQHFGDDQQQRKRNGTNSRSSSSSGSGTKNSEEFEIRELHRQFWMQRNASAVQGWQHIGEGNQNDAHNQQNNTRRGRRSPPVNSWDHYVEVLAVADYRMLLYHQQNLENYVLTLFSTVASIYRHPSLGVAVNVVVVRLVILKSEKAGPMISNRAQETLQHFCQWQQLYNDHRNEESLNHHDVAILLTRHDICSCRATNKCDTLGLAELGTMCDAKRSCAIIEDNGLSAAFTIAHELGHIFNIPHDDERKCAEFMPLNKANYHIMAPTLEYNTNPWSWSACSSAMLIRFLDTQKGQTQCILDQPAEKRYYEKMFETPAPGAIYSVSQQCKFVFGSSAEICPYMPSCRRLWCSVSYGNQLGCRTQHMPWADGTECGHQMWCYRGQCVGMSPSQRQPVDGGWGDWNPWHDCSRTCGGGIQKAYRDCDSPRPENGGKYCTGQRVRYRPCNIEDCPWDMPGFREQQCSEFDGKDVGIHEVPRETRWLPKYTGVAENERCRLYCRAADSAAFYLLGEKVIDGTPCDRNGHDICIDGACHKAGCDHRLGSDMKRDICGVCGGDGGTCREVKGLYNDKGTFGYNEVLRIPAGTANIDITQSAHNNLGEDDNYLALRMANGEWLLNGQYQVSVFRQQIPVLDAVLEYSGSDTAQERINGTGPLRSDIYLHVLCVGSLNNPNVNYRFMEPIPQQLQQQQMRAVEQQVKVANSFYWRQLDQWTECSHKCQGSQNQQLACADTLSNRPAPEAYCAAIRRPAAQQRMCNEECNYKYQHMLKADSSGRHWYQHKCVRSFTTGREEYATESECQLAGIPMPTLEPKPAESSASREVQPQQKPQSIPTLQPQIVTDRRWAYTEWNQCSESCGTSGIRRRALHCIDTRNGQKLDNRFCEGILHESTETECNRMPCPHWVFGPWSECSRSCGGGIRLRHAACQDSVGRDVHMTLCSVAYKKDSEKCNEQQCSEWRFGPWSQCSVSCGQGVERREARCVDTEGRPLNEAACNARKRIVEQKCELAACPQWKTGSWSQCSVTCGVDGFHTRVVQCVDSVGRKLVDQRCLKNEDDVRPQTHKVCSPGPCPHWRTTDWSKCSVSCGQGVRERQVECVTLDGTVDDSLCPDKQRPLRQDRCVLMACAFWSPEAWSSCSTTCGLGVQRRAVNCIRSSFSRLQGNRSIVVHDRECSGQKPRIERSCERLPCSPTLAGGAHWDTGFWTDCSAQTCVENGTQRRTVECRNAQRLLPSSFCSHLERPPTAQTCICPNSTGEKEPMTIISITTTQLPGMKKLKSTGHWEAGNWSSCSISCGGGWRRRSLFCNTANGTFGPCPEADRPVQFEQCNQQHCSIGQWHIGAWSPCSVTCGGGEQNRKVWCNSAVNLLQRLEASQCPVEEKPLGSRVCTRPKCPSNMLIITTTTEATKTLTKTINDELPSESPTRAVVTFTPSLKPSESGSSEKSLPNSVPSTEASSSNLQPRWESGPWSPCPRHCGPTVRTRKVHCVDPASGQSIVDQSKCPKAQKPPAEHRCRQMSCPRWHKGDWTLCSTSCGIGVSQREVYCRKGRIAAQRVSDVECLVAESKPFETRRCELARCPNYNWRVGPWSKCADPCKPGEQRRRIFCMSDLGKRAAHKMCEPNGKKSTAAQPAETRKCPTDKCPYHWVAGPWSTCSRTCGTGFHFRRIECKVRKKPTAETNNSSNANIGTEPTVLSRMCIALEKPQVTRQCVLSATCDAEFHWSVGPWSQCSRNCGPGFRHRKVRCLDSRGDRAARDSCETKNRPRRREACFLRNCMPADCSELKAQQIFIGSEQTMNDGNYTVLVAGFQIGVYCYRMNETLPKTYLNVRSDGNFAEFYGKRLVYPYSCPHEGRRNESCACTSDGHIGQGLSRFRKIRVDLQNMKINSNDHTFAVTEYGSPVAYGTAGDCYSMSDCPQGRFSINLRGTGLRLVDDLHWTDQGHRTSSRIERSENNALIQGFCGGYCGECAPDRFKGLALEVDQRQSPIIGAA